MNIGIGYSVEKYVHKDRPLTCQKMIPFGISYIATVLKKGGHNVELFVTTPDTDDIELLEEYIKRYSPKLFCITAVTSQIHIIYKLAEAVKKIDPSIFVVLGGHYATLSPQNAIEMDAINAICIGEGERAVLELASRLEKGENPSRIHNLWIKNGEKKGIEKNVQDPFIQDLDSIPMLDRGLWEKWVVDMDYVPAVLVGRGCPFRCTYCSNHALSEISEGKYVRFRSPKNIVKEIWDIVNLRPEVDTIYLEVETLGTKLKYVYELADELEKFNKSRIDKIKFGTNLTVTNRNYNNIDFLQTLARANFKFINVGLESGSERLRNEVLRRPRYTNKNLIEFCDTARKYSIEVVFYILLGLPGETVADYKETVKCARKAQPKDCYVSVFFPYPGTDLYDIALKLGVLKEEEIDPSAERTFSNLDLPGFSRFRIRYEYILFYMKVYWGYRPVSQLLRHTLGLIVSPQHKNLVKILIKRSRLLRFMNRRLLSVPIVVDSDD